MKKENEYIFISNGYKGGAATFLNQHIEFLLKNKKKVILIDDNPFNTFENLNSKINIYKVNVNSNNENSKKKINRILNSGKERKILFITNYAILINALRAPPKRKGPDV